MVVGGIPGPQLQLVGLTGAQRLDQELQELLPDPLAGAPRLVGG